MAKRARKAKPAKMKANRLSEVAGVVIIVAALEILFFVLLAQHMYPNYSLNNNYISDLGVGSTAGIFNPAIIIFGLLIIGAGVLLWASGRYKYIALGFVLLGLGGMGVGLFPETTGLPHLISAFFAFGGGGVLALAFSRIFKGRMAIYSALAGILGLFLLIFFGAGLAAGLNIHIGLGHGAIEEIIFYNELLWSLIVGISLVKKCV